MKKMIACILLDLVGILTMIIPGIGDVLDIVWAPISAYSANKIFGKNIAIINFIEEILPGTDWIPTFTIAYIYESIKDRKGRKENQNN